MLRLFMECMCAHHRHMCVGILFSVKARVSRPDKGAICMSARLYSMILPQNGKQAGKIDRQRYTDRDIQTRDIQTDRDRQTELMNVTFF